MTINFAGIDQHHRSVWIVVRYEEHCSYIVGVFAKQEHAQNYVDHLHNIMDTHTGIEKWTTGDHWEPSL